MARSLAQAVKGMKVLKVSSATRARWYAESPKLGDEAREYLRAWFANRRDLPAHDVKGSAWDVLAIKAEGALMRDMGTEASSARRMAAEAANEARQAAKHAAEAEDVAA